MSANQEVHALKAHLALNVRNVERSIDFYRKMLGTDPSKVREGYAKFDVENPPLNLTLNQHPVTSQGALSHLGIQVRSTEDVLAIRQKWVGEGLLTRDEMQTNCCYALQDKTWVRDPDGNEWEVFVVLKDNLSATSECECAANSTKTDATSAQQPALESVACCAPAPIGVSRESHPTETGCC